MGAERTETPIAVVGMACRFPQAESVEEFWAGLVGNVDAVTPIPPERFDVAAHYAPAARTPGRTVSRHGGFVPDPFGFDPGFFGISPAEAVTMDPQHRLLLMVVREALDAAGIPAPDVRGSTAGVFIGQATADYAGPPAGDDSLAAHTLREATGSHFRAMAAGRISYDLDLRGPSMTVDTACSSSLVAVHMARQSLLSGETDLAIAGGANIILSPRDAVAFSQGGMLSPDGRCKFGDSEADGFVRSEGVGVVVLKRLRDAEQAGDPVLGVLLGSSVTNDGRAGGSLVKPAVDGQAAMLREALRSAGVRASQLHYVEAHGTGTPVGDTVELRALTQVLREDGPVRRRLPVGSVKSNIGHTEAAAGVAGLIKALLVVRHGLVPASLHLRDPQPLLAGDDCPLEVVAANRPLETGGERALAGVSSFGLSGTNAHVVVAAAPAPPAVRPHGPTELPAGRPAHLLVLSAHSPTALRRTAADHAAFLGADGAGRALPLWDVCATAALKRQAHPYRLWAVGADHDELAEVLSALAEDRPTDHGGMGEAGFDGPRPTAFVFPGQGSQWTGMERSLRAQSPAFARALTECDALVRAETGRSVLQTPASATGDFPDDVATVQPVLWSMQVALAALWRDMGVDPDLCVGHSMGEAAAAAVAGGLTPADAAAVICRRSALMQGVTGRGAMLAVELSPEQARDAIAEDGGAVCVAVENAPRSCVLAGDADALRRIAARLERREVFHRQVQVNVASHSPAMEPLRAELLARLADLTPRQATIPMLSTVTGALLAGPELDAGYWMDNLREPVLFHDAIRHLAKENTPVFVEISPHPLLQGAIRDTLLEAGCAPTVIASLHRRGPDGPLALARSLGAFFAHGGRVDWERWFRGEVRRVPLPALPWDTEPLRRPLAPPVPAPLRSATEVRADLREAVVRVGGLAPVPPAVHLAVLHEAVVSGTAAADPGAVAIEDIRLSDELVEIPSDRAELALRVHTEARDGALAAEVYAGPGAARTLCLTATVRSGADPAESGTAAGAVPDGRKRLDTALGRCRTHLTRDEFLAGLATRGYEPSPALVAVRHLWRRDGEAVAQLHRPAISGPAAWEACLLPLLAAVPGSVPAHWAYRVAGLDRARFLAALTPECWVHATFRAERGAAAAGADVAVLDPDGRPLAEFRGIRLCRLGAAPDGPTTVRPLWELGRSAGALVAGAVRTLHPVGTDEMMRLPGLLAQRLFRAVRATGAAASPPCAPGAARGTAAAVPAIRAVEAPAGEPVRAETDPGRRDAAARFVEIVAGVVGTRPARIDTRRRLSDYGVDSLSAVQVRNRVREELGQDMPLARLLGDSTLQTLAQGLAAAC
ncbi:beta-ketoacyl synthase N-terminal-like domain-containing protein [Streptomyces sp. NPDC007189]|uniref:type I polyketide synthase n=1 Tax=Streptomyces sp. NPDC007189 TaxID=3154315 RepID=UPI003451B040